MYPKKLQKLIEDFSALPGVGEKTAEKYALKILSLDYELVEKFASDLIDAKNNIKACKTCGNMSEDDECVICKDTKRNHKQICVVQEAKDVIAMEKTGYTGVYHVLNGVISPSKGILPNMINIESLEERVDKGVDEVILATNPTMDGETTALYLTKLLKEKNINVSRLAHGLPMGSNLDYADELTLLKALEGRRKE